MGRWLTFNAVGAMGIGVQLGVLALLVRGAGLHYLPATALAVEAAVLHNFLWHQRWTWRDRPPASPGATLVRLARFHVLNGAISISGNLVLMVLLAGVFGLDPLLASGVAIAACSLVNYVVSDAMVFTRQGAKRLRPMFFGLVVLLGGPAGLFANRPDEAAEPRPDTVAAWQGYDRPVDARYQAASAAERAFFAYDRFAVEARWRQIAVDGGMPMTRLDAPAPGTGRPEVPGGRIHHWVGAVFVPGRTVANVISRLQDAAGREADLYEDVEASKLLDRDGDRLRVFLKLRRTAVITVHYNTEHVVEYRRLGHARGSHRSVATRIAELADAGTPREREKPPGDDRGFLWRLNAYWRYEEREGGVLIECESVSLSRDVPLVVRPVVGPIVNRIARESLEKTLRELRAALLGGGP